ncbi:MAG: hypothetical protein U0234_16170 [Sandaracinus sp.]
MPEILLHVTTRRRGAPRLDEPELDAADPGLDALTRAVGSEAPIVLVGGEPTLRADLPALLGTFPGATLRTDGLALAGPGVLASLRRAGLGKLRIVLHSARLDAHDWIVKTPGAARTAMRTLRAAAELGLETEIEATLTRSTAPHVAELVALAEGVRARSVHLVRLAHRGPAARDTIMLAPRMALLEDPLDEALAAAIRARIALFVHGYPSCVAPRLEARVRPSSDRSHRFVSDDAWDAVARAYAVTYGARCPGCPGAPRCDGAAAEYVARFGAAELLSEMPREPRPTEPAPSEGAPSSVAPRAGRAPTTRLRDVRAVVRRAAVQGDPLIDRPRSVPPVLRVSLAPAETTTRVLRARLLRAAQEGAPIVRVSGGLDHPSLAALLREAARLPGPEVEVAGDLAPLGALADAQIFELQGIVRALAAVFAPEDLERTRAILERLSRIAKIAGQPYVVLRSHDEAPRWAAPFEALEGEPFVRLAGAGSLSALAAYARALPTSRWRTALARVLPRTSDLVVDDVPPADAAPPAFVDGVSTSAPVGDDEPFGAFDPCDCGRPHCPGRPRRWTA